MSNLIRFSIKNFKGIVSFECEPNGKSITLRGSNASGKTSCVDSLFWGLGGALDGDVVHHKAEKAETEIIFGEYIVTRRQKRGKRPDLIVKSADGKSTLNSPTALLAGFIGAIERRTFSQRPEKERQEIIRRLAPGLDTSDLDKEYAEVYEDRTFCNRQAKTLHAQADGITVPPLPADLGEEIDVAEIAEKKAEAEKQRAANEKERVRLRAINDWAEAANQNAEKAKVLVGERTKQLAAAHEELRQALADLDVANNENADAKAELATITDPDTSTIDAEISEAKKKNAAIRAAKEERTRCLRLKEDKDSRISQANEKDAESAKLTKRLEEIEAEKKKRTTAANLPVAGLTLTAEGIRFDDDDGRGPMAVDELSTGQRIRLDVLIGKAQGYRLIAVRDASLLDDDGRAMIDEFAKEQGVQLIQEVVATGEELHAVIEEGA